MQTKAADFLSAAFFARMYWKTTEEILKKALDALRLPLEKPEKINISCGELLQIDCKGNLTRDCFCTDNLQNTYYGARPWIW